jgi:prepilin peptidase CpaA
LWVPPLLFLNLLIIMALLGGALTLVLGAWHVMRRRKGRLAIPYGVAIASAGLWVIGTNYLPAAGNFTGVSG